MQHWPTYTIVFGVEKFFRFPEKISRRSANEKIWILTAMLKFVVREIRLPKFVPNLKEELKELVGWEGEEVCRKMEAK